VCNLKKKRRGTLVISVKIGKVQIIRSLIITHDSKKGLRGRATKKGASFALAHQRGGL
jgi:hypothetical protein